MAFPERDIGLALARQHFEKMNMFVQMGTGMGIQNFILQGPIGDTKFTTFVGVYQSPSIETGYVAVGEADLDAISLANKLLQLQLPERVRQLQIHEEAETELTLERLLAFNGLPSTVIAIGNAHSSQEEVVALFTVAGRTPQRALSLVQDTVRQRLHKLN